MPTYKAPVGDVMFLLSDVFHIDRYNNLPGFADATPDLVEAVLDEAAKFCEDVLTPLNRVGDKEGCKRHAGRLGHHADRVQGRLQAADGGRLDRRFGAGRIRRPGPAARALASRSASSWSRRTWPSPCIPGLTQGAAAALIVHGSPEQKALYLPKLISGEWTGTMNLTEPQCGTDLGLCRTRAVPQPDGSYKITGTKIFISAGEHDLAENIVHLVLARIEGAPEGVKGISLFIVPKFLPTKDGARRRAQRRFLRLDRREDGHPRQFDLRDELRRRHRLAGGRAQSRPQRHVRDDERSAARRRRAGAGDVGSRLSERRRLRQGAACRAAR